MFWADFLVNFLSSVVAGIVLGIIGITSYKVYRYFEKTNIRQDKIEQKSKSGKNIVYNINLTTNSSTNEELLAQIKELLKNQHEQ